MAALAILGLFLLNFCVILGAADFSVDLRTGTYTQSRSNNGITWVTKPYTPNSNLGTCGCHVQGVLRLTFDRVNRTRAEFRLRFDNATGFSFNIGDSSTNNGYGGDAATQDSDAEIHGIGKELRFYGKGIPNQYAQWYGLLYRARDFLKDQDVVINVQDQLVTSETENHYVYINTFKTFNLDGQYDSEGPVNWDVYFALNRVISGSYRSGTGLCKAEITWHSDKL